MFVAYVVLAVLLAAALAMSAALKLRKAERSVEGIHGVVGVPLSWFPYLAACELAGAVGLLVGIAWAPIGIAAAIGVILYMLSAIAAHVRVADHAGIITPLVLLAVAVAALVTRTLSA